MINTRGNNQRETEHAIVMQTLILGALQAEQPDLSADGRKPGETRMKTTCKLSRIL